MISILKRIRKIEAAFDRRAEYFVYHHPCLAFCVMFFFMPLLLLGTVAFSTVVITFPLALLFGWC